jgi:hypothetical protein
MTPRDPFYLGWRAQMPSRADPIDPEYLDTPYLTAAVNLCSALGVFIGAWTAMLLLGALHRGVARYWPFVLILAIDVVVNIAVRVVRARKRRAHPPEPPRSARRVQRGAQRHQVS